MGTGFGFVEKMAGTYKGRAGGFPGGAFSFELDVKSDDLARGVLNIRCDASGWVNMQGVVTDAPATGFLEVSPLWKRTIRYVVDFSTAEGRRLHFEGQKTIDWLRPFSTWTTLPGSVTDVESGEVVADVVARFDLRRDFTALVRSGRILRVRRARRAEAV